MPTHQGQTDQVVKIKLQSYLLLARWLENDIAGNGEAVLEVITAYVGDGAKVEVAIKDLQGKTLETLKGSIYSNMYRARYRIAPGNRTGGMTLEASLPAHGLKLVGGGAKVGMPVEFSDLKWLKATEESAPEAAEEGQLLRLQAKVKGLSEGDMAHIRLMMHVHAKKFGSPVLLDAEAPVKSGKIEISTRVQMTEKARKVRTQSELDKEGGKYHQPSLAFQIRAKGVQAESSDIPLISKLSLHFEESPGHAGKLEGKKITITTPDGKTQQKTIPKNGVVLLDKTKPGKHKITGEGIKKLAYTEKAAHPVSEATNSAITKEDKIELVRLITLSEGGKGESAYWAMNLDYEFEGRWDLPKGWWKKGKDGKSASKPDKSDPNVPYSKYSDKPRHVGLSYGTIQFTQEGPLGEVVKAMQAKDGGKFKEVFGEHSDDLVKTLTKKGDFVSENEEILDNHGESLGLKKVRRRPSVQPVGGHELWQSYWTEKFKLAGSHKPFQECQDEKAVTQYLDPCLKALHESGIPSISQKGLALLYDRSVNNGVGRARKLVAGLAKVQDEKKFWKDTIADLKDSVKARMQHLANSDAVSWDKLFLISEIKPVAKEKTPAVAPSNAATPASSNTGASPAPATNQLKKGATGTRVQELNIRLTGFGEGEPSLLFDSKTETRVKTFQKEYLGKAAPSGIFDEETATALDEFAGTHLISPETPNGKNHLRCPCGKCAGFGSGKYKGEYFGSTPSEARHKYEYPGMHRGLLWSIAAFAFRITKHTEYGLQLDNIFSGYRCWHDNEAHGRKTTNHMGKACDLHIKIVSGKTMRQSCDLARNFFKDHMAAQIGWSGSNRLSLEPGDIAPTWVHFDVRQYAANYLADSFFTQTLAGLKGGSAKDLLHA